MGVIMKSTSVKLFSCAFVLISVLTLLGFGGPQNAKAASETPPLTVNQILEQVEKKYANSKFAADFIQNSTILVCWKTAISD